MTPSENLVALGRDRVVLLPRDPWGGYVYWEITAEGLGNAAGSSEPRLQLLIVKRTDGGEEIVTKLPIDSWLDGQFISFREEDVDYVARVGVEVGGDFVPLATSMPVRSPRTFPGEREPRFVRVSLSDEGLVLTPTEHEHPELGTFAAAERDLPSSS